ncbi:MAG: hypothetical protein HGN29_03775 [Asgard group archaeon]|nr:hypothetical protein [Asgard group archaeon]
MNEKKQVESSKSKEKKKISSNTRTFIVGTIIWSSIFLVIPPIVFLVEKDWIVALSISGKIGIGFIALSLILLGAVGTPRATGAQAGKLIVDYKGGWKEEEEEISMNREKSINYLEILSIGRVWMLLWGIIYLIPYAFNIPFIL